MVDAKKSCAPSTQQRLQKNNVIRLPYFIKTINRLKKNSSKTFNTYL